MADDELAESVQDEIDDLRARLAQVEQDKDAFRNVAAEQERGRRASDARSQQLANCLLLMPGALDSLLSVNVSELPEAINVIKHDIESVVSLAGKTIPELRPASSDDAKWQLSAFERLRLLRAVQ